MNMNDFHDDIEDWAGCDLSVKLRPLNVSKHPSTSH